MSRRRPGGTQSARSPRSQPSILFACFAAFAFLIVGCGKKGAPLPPLVKLPVPPADLAATRRGNIVDLSFSVPSANTDGTRPANVQRTEVYAITATINAAAFAPRERLTECTATGPRS